MQVTLKWLSTYSTIHKANRKELRAIYFVFHTQCIAFFHRYQQKLDISVRFQGLPEILTSDPGQKNVADFLPCFFAVIHIWNAIHCSIKEVHWHVFNFICILIWNCFVEVYTIYNDDTSYVQFYHLIQSLTTCYTWRHTGSPPHHRGSILVVLCYTPKHTGSPPHHRGSILVVPPRVNTSPTFSSYILFDRIPCDSGYNPLKWKKVYLEVFYTYEGTS